MSNYATYPSLKDRAVFVTGGGSGIGAAIVENFCAQGSKVAFVDIAREASEALVKSIAVKKLPAPLFIPCDITDTAALQRAIAETKQKLGPVRVLVNNAAHDQRHAIDTVTPEYWDDRIAVNLKHQFFAAQAVYKDMAAAGGGSIEQILPETHYLPEGVRMIKDEQLFGALAGPGPDHPFQARLDLVKLRWIQPWQGQDSAQRIDIAANGNAAQQRRFQRRGPTPEKRIVNPLARPGQSFDEETG